MWRQVFICLCGTSEPPVSMSAIMRTTEVCVLICATVWHSNQMETMVAWMVGNITATNSTGTSWMISTNGIHEYLYYDGHELLNSMPTMKLGDWVQLIAESTEDLSSRPLPSDLDSP